MGAIQRLVWEQDWNKCWKCSMVYTLIAFWILTIPPIIALKRYFQLTIKTLEEYNEKGIVISGTMITATTKNRGYCAKKRRAIHRLEYLVTNPVNGDPSRVVKKSDRKFNDDARIQNDVDIVIVPGIPASGQVKSFLDKYCEDPSNFPTLVLRRKKYVYYLYMLFYICVSLEVAAFYGSSVTQPFGKFNITFICFMLIVSVYDWRRTYIIPMFGVFDEIGWTGAESRCKSIAPDFFSTLARINNKQNHNIETEIPV